MNQMPRMATSKKYFLKRLAWGVINGDISLLALAALLSPAAWLNLQSDLLEVCKPERPAGGLGSRQIRANESTEKAANAVQEKGANAPPLVVTGPGGDYRQSFYARNSLGGRVDVWA